MSENWEELEKGNATTLSSWCHVALLEWKSAFLGFNNSNNSLSLSLSPLSLLPCQRVLWPRRIRICVSFSLYKAVSLSTNTQHQQTTTTAISFSLSIYSFICLPPSLSISFVLSLLVSPCPKTTPFLSVYPLLPFSTISCNLSPYSCLIHQQDWYAS